MDGLFDHEVSEGAQILLGDGWGIESLATAETLATGQSCEFLRFVTTWASTRALRDGNREWGQWAYWVLNTPEQLANFRNRWQAQQANPQGPRAKGERPYTPWDGQTLPDGTSFGSPNLPIRIQEWLDRMADKRRAIDPKYLQMALDLGARIPEWFASGPVPDGHLMPGTKPLQAWVPPTDPLDDQAAWLLMKQYIQLPRAVEVLKDGGVRKIAERPANWSDAQVALLTEAMETDPFPPPSPREDVERVVMDRELQEIMNRREPKPPDEEPPKLVLVKRREEVVVPVEPFLRAAKEQQRENERALESEAPEMDPDQWDSLTRSDPPPGVGREP